MTDVKKMNSKQKAVEFLKGVLYKGETSILYNLLLTLTGIAMISTCKTWYNEHNDDGGFMKGTITNYVVSMLGINKINIREGENKPDGKLDNCCLYSGANEEDLGTINREKSCCTNEIKPGCIFNNSFIKNFFLNIIPYYSAKYYMLFANFLGKIEVDESEIKAAVYPFIFPMIYLGHKYFAGFYTLFCAIFTFLQGIQAIDFSYEYGYDEGIQDESTYAKGALNIWIRILKYTWTIIMFFVYIWALFFMVVLGFMPILSFLLAGIPFNPVSGPGGYLNLYNSEYTHRMICELFNVVENSSWKSNFEGLGKNLINNPYFKFSFIIFTFLIPYWYNINKYFGTKTGPFNLYKIINKDGMMYGAIIGSVFFIISQLYKFTTPSDE